MLPEKNWQKTVMIVVNGEMAMAVLPASYQVDFDVLKELLGTKNVTLASEFDFKNLFPDCELGAMPPFGNLYGMEVYAAESLNENEEIAFNAGSHTELIRLKYSDYKQLVQPKILKFSWKTVSFPHDPREKWEEE
jgi:Ala-tRNA(Pro) deacylase